MRWSHRRDLAVRARPPVRALLCIGCAYWLGAALAAPQTSAPVAESGPAPTLAAGVQQGLSTQAGVFAPAQSQRGEAAYMETCKRCHQRDLMGDFVEDSPPLVGDEFMDEWEQWTLGDLFEYVTTEMPPKPKDRRGVSAQNYADIIAFILEKNGLPPGDAELPAEFEALSLIEIDP